jgi:hypothetical protein
LARASGARPETVKLTPRLITVDRMDRPRCTRWRVNEEASNRAEDDVGWRTGVWRAASENSIAPVKGRSAQR